MKTADIDRARQSVVDAARRWKAARSKWYTSATDKNADDWNYAEQRLSDAISAYEKAAQIATAEGNAT